ncbi:MULTISPECIES: FecR family protein [Butyricimonas]|uniref:FecR family protein n=1 Tax=Butyricimonas TaxID=574697 RepID=UPI001D0653DC|nr:MULTISPECIES: FecR domain-containing protein [Butyricimonas]MCB6972707.1 FecR domain-containing protein [Butyricimonas synergistica]MCG4519715.1 FecR domain-containing protein [Butyricimonas sp. DFI.6.44]
MIDWWIIEKSLDKKLTPQEKQFFDEWLEASPKHRMLYDKIKCANNMDDNTAEFTRWRQAFREKLIARKRQEKKRIFLKLSVAAAVLLLFLGSGYWWLSMENKPHTIVEPFAQEPSRNAVHLTTASGKVLNLSSQTISDTLKIDGAKLVKDQGTLIYEKNPEEPQVEQPMYNEIEVPKGAEYRLVLSDGTRVWLNSDTRMSYPTNFEKSIREVELHGEAYFEVSHNASKPFIVRTGELTVTVLGTEFNVNTRIPTSIRTTLVEGKVQVAFKEGIPYTLTPGEMATTDLLSGQTTVEQVNIKKYIAWRHGRFCFEEATIEEIMQELSLWYDIRVEYQNSRVKEEKFSGYLPRGESVMSILQKIEQTSYVHFKMVQNKIIVGY